MPRFATRWRHLLIGNFSAQALQKRGDLQRRHSLATPIDWKRDKRCHGISRAPEVATRWRHLLIGNQAE